MTHKLPEEPLMKIRPLHDRVLVKRVEEEQVSRGGIIIPDTAKEKPMKGQVVAVGSGKLLKNGDVRGLTVSEGDIVLYSKYAGTEVKLDGTEHLIMREDDILGVIA
jgi:chaperonin GroES